MVMLSVLGSDERTLTDAVQLHDSLPILASLIKRMSVTENYVVDKEITVLKHR